MEINVYKTKCKSHQSMACCKDVLSLHDDSTNLSLYILPHRHSMSGTEVSDVSIACSKSDHNSQTNINVLSYV